MSHKAEATPCIVAVLWLALVFLLGQDVLVNFAGYRTSWEYLILVLLVGIPLLAIASNMPENTNPSLRGFVALWLALFLLWGFVDILFSSYPTNAWPWIGYFTYGLIIGVPLLVVASKPVAALGVIRLTVYTGFLIIVAYLIFNLLHGYDWFGMYVRLGVGMFGGPDGFTGIEAIDVWIERPDWISVRLVTYVGLGYLAAKRKGLLRGIDTSILVALADSTLGWLVFLPHGGDFEAMPLWAVLEYHWRELLRAIFIQVSILAFFALIGAMTTRVRVPLPQRRYRPARRIAVRNRLG